MIDRRKATHACDSCGTISRLRDLAHPNQWAISRGVHIKIFQKDNLDHICRACFKEKYEDG